MSVRSVLRRFRNLALHALDSLRMLVSSTPDKFHRLYYDTKDQTWFDTYWLGVSTLKCPLDLWVYQEILCEVRPDVIIETGTAYGGSALFLASMCDLLRNGRVVTIDIAPTMGHGPERPTHPRITYLTGSSTSPESIDRVKNLLSGNETIMVILDSDHSRDHVLEEMRIYGQFVSEGSYLIVEDTNVNGHPVLPSFGPGPMEAVECFLEETDGFFADRSREKFFLTFNPKGYLKRGSPK